jgi:hypothetical protein
VERVERKTVSVPAIPAVGIVLAQSARVVAIQVAIALGATNSQRTPTCSVVAAVAVAAVAAVVTVVTAVTAVIQAAPIAVSVGSKARIRAGVVGAVQEAI